MRIRLSQRPVHAEIIRRQGRGFLQVRNRTTRLAALNALAESTARHARRQKDKRVNQMPGSKSVTV
jgi:hypothetical protein